jgi:hypothetical protein
VEQVEGRWYCAAHKAAAKAVARKRRDRGLGQCSIDACSRPAASADGKCSEHLAGERAAGAPVVIVDDGSGKGDHPYAPKRTEIYLAVFPDAGVLKVGKATPWTVRSRIRDAADKLRIRQRANGATVPAAREPLAWAIPLFGDKNVPWAVSERVEHAAAGRLAHNVGATTVPHAQGKEWLQYEPQVALDWPPEFARAVRETLAFFGHNDTDAGDPRSIG